MEWKQSRWGYIRQPPANQNGNSLTHYGILGQKWGIRRFQNEDGTLTEEGKRRYNSGREKDYGLDGDVIRKNSNKKTEVWKRSDAPNLSDEELNRRNSRLQRERQYKDLTIDSKQKLKEEFKKNGMDLLKKALWVIPVGIALVALKNKAYPKLFNFIGKTAKTALNSMKFKRNMATNTLKSYKKYTSPFTTIRQPRNNVGVNPMNLPKDIANMLGYKKR